MEKLFDLLGEPFEKFAGDGTYLNCLYPLYVAYPDLPRYKMPKGNAFEFALKKFQEHLKKIDPKDIQKGDIVIFYKLQRTLHVGIYVGNDKVIHCGLERVELLRLKTVKHLIQWVYRK
jgi:hypothetical protein